MVPHVECARWSTVEWVASTLTGEEAGGDQSQPAQDTPVRQRETEQPTALDDFLAEYVS
jgi:hypothetical protein